MVVIDQEIGKFFKRKFLKERKKQTLSTLILGTISLKKRGKSRQ